MKWLTPHFALEELTYSSVALRHGIDNEPSVAAATNLFKLCRDVLEPVRELLNCPLHVDSGYRSETLNELVGSTSKHSDHLDGNAADVIPIDMPIREAFDLIRASNIPFKQLILECGAWIHLSRGDEPHREALLASGSPGNWTYTTVV